LFLLLEINIRQNAIPYILGRVMYREKAAAGYFPAAAGDPLRS
jgi:hypothetical protein